MSFCENYRVLPRSCQNLLLMMRLLRNLLLLLSDQMKLNIADINGIYLKLKFVFVLMLVLNQDISLKKRWMLIFNVSIILNTHFIRIFKTRRNYRIFNNNITRDATQGATGSLTKASHLMISHSSKAHLP